MKKLLLAMSLLALATTSRAEEVHYVIKVTPALVYIDVGLESGAAVGGVYMVLREDGKLFAPVAEATLIRVGEGYSIGEITYVSEGEIIEVLQRVIAQSDWQMMGENSGAMVRDKDQAKPRMRGAVGKRSVHFLAGGDFGRDAELTWNKNILTDASPSNGIALGLRLGQVLKERWRVNMTYRASLGAGVTGLAIEADVHRLLRDYDRAGPYFGIGAGMHQLSVDAPGTNDDSANKVGFNATVGLQVPGRWSFIAETGYQYVLKWGRYIDVSNVRAYVGLGRTF
jgi:opacity protein-like surface antigen